MSGSPLSEPRRNASAPGPAQTRLPRLLAGFALIVGLASLPPASHAAGNGYLLRPETVTQGQVTQENVHASSRNARMKSLLNGRQQVSGTMNIDNVSTTRTEVVASRYGMPSVLKETTLSDVTTTTARMGDEISTETENGALTGCTVLIEQKNGSWIKSLIGQSPNPEQDAELRSAYADDNDLYPAVPVSVGDTWTIDGARLAAIWGMDAERFDSDSRATLKLEGFEYVMGERCAVIAVYPMTVSGTMERQGEAFRISFTGRGLIYRSLAKFVDVQTEMEGTATLEGDSMVDGNRVQTSVTMPMVIRANEVLITN